MREIRDCTAEVFRRSEIRIQARKQKRKRILVNGATMLICLTVLSAAFFPALRPLEKGDAVQENMGPTAGKAEMATAPASYVRLEIQENGQYYALVEESLEVSQIYHVVKSMFDTKDDLGTEVKPDSIISEKVEDFSSATQEAPEEALGYTMTFSTAEGSTVTYTLTGNRLIDASTEQSVALSENQLAELKEALGIPEK